jgi:dTMP kinase
MRKQWISFKGTPIVKAKFITLEGGEGVGKTTNLAFIEDYLRMRGVPLLRTREPGGTPLGEKVREILLHSDQVDATAELLLVFAARAQHVEEVIRPALERGEWVLSDRFTDASYAYQGGGRGIPKEIIAYLENLVQKTLRPDLTLLLDTPVAVGMARARARGPQDRFEVEADSFFERVRKGYLDRMRNEPNRIRVIDASQALPEVQAAISQELNSLFTA